MLPFFPPSVVNSIDVISNTFRDQNIYFYLFSVPQARLHPEGQDARVTGGLEVREGHRKASCVPGGGGGEEVVVEWCGGGGGDIVGGVFVVGGAIVVVVIAVERG